MMGWRGFGLLVALLVAAVPVQALKREELSASAQALLPPNAGGTAIKLKSGSIYSGMTVTEDSNADQLTLRITRGGVTATRAFVRTDIIAQKESDVADAFGKVLLKRQLNPDNSFPLKAYRDSVRLFLEYLQRCKGSPDYEAVKALSVGFMNEMFMVSQGQEKVNGQWYTPVAAACRKFEVYGEQLAALEKSSGFRRDEALQAEHATLLDTRRAAARSLPKLTKDRVETLIGEGHHLDAAEEINAFMEFWQKQVLASESRKKGDADQVMAQMDFSYILDLMQAVADSYNATEKGKGKPPAGLEIPDDMVYIPGGLFLMGDAGSERTDSTFPVHFAYVSPYLLDKYEVSNAQYREFVDHVVKTREVWMEHKDAPPLKKHEPEGWDKKNLSDDQQPVMGVDWFDAYAYAKWAKKRLPTEAEWERAARGHDARLFPWGEVVEGVAINYAPGRKFIAEQMDLQNPPMPPEPPISMGCSCATPSEFKAPPPTKLPSKSWPVDSMLPAPAMTAIEKGLFEWDRLGLSPYGAYHMAGNAPEWVQDRFAFGYYVDAPVRDPQGPEGEGDHIYRGGSYVSAGTSDLKGYARGNAQSGSGSKRRRPASKSKRKGMPLIGLRCARSLGAGNGDAADDGETMEFQELIRRLAPYIK